jgi:quercetin dioxygenase-like cupin family protein
VKTVNLNTLDLMEGWFADDPTVHFRANFALSGGNGTSDSAVVYIELEPGLALGNHTDSPEEVLLVLEGEIEFLVGEERARGGPGTLAVVPPMVEHGMRNVGDGPARIVGFFPNPGVVATFVSAIQPIDQRVMIFGEAAIASATAG